MDLKDEIVDFLSKNTFLNKINFSFSIYRVYPSAFQKDVVNAINTGDIIVSRSKALPTAVGARYDMNYDSIELGPKFNIALPRDQAFLVHECTHAHLDIQNIGSHSGYANESVAYLAEAVYLEAAAQPPLGDEEIRIVSHALARKVLSGTYSISPSDAKILTDEVAKYPHYSATVLYNANGFNRKLIHKLLRRW